MLEKLKQFFASDFFYGAVTGFALAVLLGVLWIRNGREDTTGSSTASATISEAQGTAQATGIVIGGAGDKIDSAKDSIDRVGKSITGVEKELGTGSKRADEIQRGLGECEILVRQCLDINRQAQKGIDAGTGEAPAGTESGKKKSTDK